MTSGKIRNTFVKSYVKPSVNLLKRYIFVFIYASEEAGQTVNSLAKTYLVIFVPIFHLG